MYKYILLAGLISGLIPVSSRAEIYTGGVSQEVAQADYQANIQPTTALVQLQPQTARVKIKSRLSAIGIHWEGYQHVITYVDPSSSVYGLIFPGDREISLAGLDPKQSELRRKNYGANNTYVDIVFQKQDGRIIKLSVLRQPVANFCPEFRRTMLQY